MSFKILNALAATRAGRNTNNFPVINPSVKDGYRIHIALNIS